MVRVGFQWKAFDMVADEMKFVASRLFYFHAGYGGGQCLFGVFKLDRMLLLVS